MEEIKDDQQYYLRWNNFQANITSQFGTLRDDQDFTDVTIACEGQRFEAHKIVLSACSSYFKELFKANPCSHPIIFMRDVEACDITALMEFMYAGEVNVAKMKLPAFLKTAESLKIRGLTDTSAENHSKQQTENPPITETTKPKMTLPISVVATNQAISLPKRSCIPNDETLSNSEENLNEKCKLKLEENNASLEEIDKMEITDFSDTDRLEEEDRDEEIVSRSYFNANEVNKRAIIIPRVLDFTKNLEATTITGRRLRALEPRPCDECGKVYSNLSNLRQHMKLVHFPTVVHCQLCDTSFRTELYFRRHMTTTHENLTIQPVHDTNRDLSIKYSLKSFK